MPELRIRLTITGQVQGVGFRPFIFCLAKECSLAGFVLNAPQGVLIEVQGPTKAVNAFETNLNTRLPPLAQIVTCERDVLSPLPSVPDDEPAFIIRQSIQGTGHHVLISPDVATCPDCVQDIFDPENRRYLYPFTNCTNCGPRYTITRSIPYDRGTTSMSCFPLCDACTIEYTDPMNRRFHAQPNACACCGPKVRLMDGTGTEVVCSSQALKETAAQLYSGKILAIKGLGGFHLACDATREEVVSRLRKRKNRWGKPLAIMVPDLETAKKICHVTPEDEALLTGHIRPIVVLRKKKGTFLPTKNLSPDTEYMGVMLPYTPLHHILLHHVARLWGETRIPALVMTSGNLSSEPICLGNWEALTRLGSIADLFLLHNRDILIRCDDSVVRTKGPTTLFMRRARGYTPGPLFLSRNGPCVLGVGPELKNTLCLTKENQAFVSQHIGDMENLETSSFFQEIAAHLQNILSVTPKAIVCDLHPDYLSTRFAQEMVKKNPDLPLFQLQHHFAHIHAVLAENQYEGQALGLALDGTGLGDDGTLWGGELLWVDTLQLDHQRLGRLCRIPLPGGEKAIKEPWRIARSLLAGIGIREPDKRSWPWLEDFAKEDSFIVQMLEKNINCPSSSSCGRLFDGVAAMLGLKLTIAYEGQAAIMLEAIQDMTVHTGYTCPVLLKDQLRILDTNGLFSQVYADWNHGVAPEIISRKFHLGLMHGLAAWAHAAAQETGTTTLGLSGGVMQNMTLATELPALVKELGLTPLLHSRIPPNDACISLGQAVYGQTMLKKLHTDI